MTMSRLTLALLLPLSVSGSVMAETSPPSKDQHKVACRGVPQEQWSAEELTRQQDIKAVQEIKAEGPVSETETTTERAGARILLRAQPGVTAEWLQRIAECHMARVAASSPATQSPLDVKGASVTVQTVGDGFAVDITSTDRVVAKQIFARARALVPPALAPR